MGSNLQPLDWAICIGYLLLVVGLGVWFARQQHTNEDYFVGGRRMHWFPIGLSIFAGTFSSLSFVGLPREAAYGDYHLLLGILFIPIVVTPIVGIWFLPLYFRLGVISAYEYLEQRFNRNIRLLGSVLFMGYTIGWMGNLLKAVGKILQVVLEVSNAELTWVLIAVGLFATLYTTMGGVKAVVWTDALQAFALGGGMLAVLVLTVGEIQGGWHTVWQTGMDHDKFEMFRMELGFTSEQGNFFAACAFGFFVYLAGHGVHFVAVQRYMSMPNIRAAWWSLVVNGVMVAGVCLIFFLVGSALFAFYQQTGDPLFGTLEQAKATDQLLPQFVLNELPQVGLTGLLLAGLFAAAMSSIDSGINSMTASVVCDWLGGKDLQLWLSRVLCVGFGLLAIAIAVFLQQIEIPVFNTIMIIAGTLLGLLLGIFLLGMLTKRANANGVAIGVAAGIAAIIFGYLNGLTHWWYGALTTVVTVAVGLPASYLLPLRTEDVEV